MKAIVVTLFAVAALLPLPASAAGLPPWKLGMSKPQVASFKEFGPYKEFKNGDLETYNGQFHGQKVNVQFFFEANHLRAIGVYLFEGTNAKEGIPACQRAYEALQKDYGDVATPEIHVDPKSGPVNAESLAIAAAVNADVTGETVMKPVKQPSGMQVYARYWTGDVQGTKWYYVAVFFGATGDATVAPDAAKACG